MESSHVFLLFLVLSVSLFTLLYCYKRGEKAIKTFLNSNTNISILYNKNKISFINNVGLEFFSFSSVDEFNKNYADLSQLFITDKECIDKYTYGQKWFKRAKDEKKYIKVKLLSKKDNMSHYFNINVSKIKRSNQYLVTFNDITLLESTKVTMVEKSENDTLTNIYNRVKFNEVLDFMIYKANKHDFKFSIILLDIDHFKAINDNYGHNVGDKVLVELSRLINMNLRTNDTFARWGGEEFVVISELTNLNEVTILASRLRKIVDDFSFTDIGKMTCSFGVTEFKIGDTQSLIFERVDKALYEAKYNGRNQVVRK